MMKKNKSSLLIILFSLIGLYSLAQPAITSYDPLKDATGVTIEKVLQLTFDQNIQPGAGGIVQVVRTNGDYVHGSYFISTGFTSSEITLSGATLTIDPIPAFDEGEEYYVTIANTAIESTGGTPFGGIDNSVGNNWRFTTTAPPPTIVTYDPIQDETGVALDKTLQLTFDQNIQAAAGGALQVVRTNGDFVHGNYFISTGFTSPEITIAGTTLTINPLVDFEEGEEYYITIANTAIESLIGTAFEGIDNSAGNNWRFTSTAPAPNIVTYDPLQDATDITVDKVLQLTFDTNIQAGAGGSVQVVKSNGDVVHGNYFISTGFTSSEITLSGMTLTIDPIPDFEEGEEYYVTIANTAIESTGSIPFAGIDNSAGNNWRFTTIASAPAIITYDPLQDATGIVVDKVLQLTFDQNIQAGAGGALQVVRTNGDVVHGDYFISTGFTSPEITISGATLTIDPLVDFDEGEEYYITIANTAIESTTTGTPFGGIDNSAGNNWRFTTTAPAPAIVTFDPLQDATEVAINKILQLTFDTNIQAGSGGTLQVVRTNGDVVHGNYFISTGFTSSEITISGTILTIDPIPDFEEGEEYYITIANSAIESTGGAPFGGIDNSAGNNWRFTTTAPAPTITTYDPLQDATDIAIDKVLQLTFDQNIQASVGGVLNIIRTNGDFTHASYLISTGFTSPEINISGTTLTIDPLTDFDEGEEYYITIDNTAVESTGGTQFGGIDNSAGNNWRFTTVSPAPTVITYNPIQDATGVAVDHTLQLTFDTNMQAGSGGVIQLYKTVGDELVGNYFMSTGFTSPELSIAGSILSINPASDLDVAQEYYVIIANTAIESTGGAPFSGIDNSAGNNWRFTTIFPAPITTLTPADGTFNVSILSNIEVLYDQAVRFIGGAEITDLNVATLITLETGGSPIPFTATINAGKTLITITPDSNLPAFSYIDVTVSPVENSAGTPQIGVQTCQFRTDQYNIWDGSESNDFGNDLNWVGDSFTNGISVLIPKVTNNPTIASVHTTNNVNIEAGAELVIESGGELILEGTLELASSNTETTGNATLVNRGTITEMPGSAMVAYQQISTEAYDYFIASPVSGATPQNTGVNGSVYRRNASNATWETLGAAEAMIPGVGYSAWSTSGTSLSFNGSFNNGASYNLNTVRTITPDNYGWNLAGNPYPCAIDWDHVGVVKTNMNNHFYVLRNESGQYGTYNGDLGEGTNVRATNPSHIPSMHAFWTQVTIGQASGTLTIPQVARVSSNYTYLKSSKASSNAKSIRFKGDKDGNLDELLIAFHSSAFDSYDVYDSEKRFASYNDHLLELFTVNDGKSLTIDTYNQVGDGMAINLGYKIKNAGTYNIVLSNIKGFDKDVVVKIEDTSDSNAPIEELVPNVPYSFTSSMGETNKNRFVLHISEQTATNINSGTISNNIKIYNSGNNIFIDLPKLTDPIFEMYDLSGRLLDNQRLQSGTLNTLTSPFDGFVIVKITSKEGIISRKLNLK